MSDSVTITLLAVSLSIVHVPRSRIHSLFHPLLRQLLHPKPTFLNLTCNEIELSLFAECHILKELEPIAQQDARRLKRRGRTSLSKDKRQSRRTGDDDWEPVEVSAEKWNVLQIDSHSSGLDTSGARIHELSAPLAKAGVSILYQSSYMSDFIFVKEHRLSEVMSLLASAGFDLYSSDPQNLTSQVSTLASPNLPPISADDGSSIQLLELSATATSRATISPENGAILTRSRSSTGSSQTSLPPLRKSPSDAELPEGDEAITRSDDGSPTAHRSPLLRSQSHSPSGCDVRILEPDLACIGLADDSAELWMLKIMKLVAFPDMIPGATTSSSSSARRPSVGSFSFEVPLRPRTEDDEAAPPLASASETDSVGSKSDTTTRVGPDSPSSTKDSAHESESLIFDIEQDRPWDDEGSSEGDDARESSDDESIYNASPHATNPTDVPSNRIHLGSDDAHITRPRLSHLDTSDTVTRHRRVVSKNNLSSRSQSTLDNLVPFYSFTRTTEGSSLTAPVCLLAALFPSSERHMVICSTELDIQDSRAASPQRVSDTLETIPEDSVQAGDECAASELEAEGTMKCLQIDLRKYGLDKHGLVSRFSKSLAQNGINHMYSSTYKTANLLVDKAHAARAQALLRSC